MKLNDRVERDLCELRQAVIERTAAYDEACEGVAAEMGCEKAVLKRYINAVVADRLDKLRDETAQLSLLLATEEELEAMEKAA